MAKKGKSVVVVVRRSPLNTVKNSEALRQGVGLTLADNKVTVILLDAAAWLAVPMSPSVVGGGDIQKHIEMLLLLGSGVEVEKESLERYGVDSRKLLRGVSMVSQEAIARELAAADAVVVF